MPTAAKLSATDKRLQSYEAKTEDWEKKLDQISCGAYHGDVNGIFFDLRHELLTYPEWSAPTLGVFGGIQFPITDLPLIWFPWFDTLHEYEIKTDLENYENDPGSYEHARPIPPRPSALRKFAGVKPEYFAEIGDKIIIDYVEEFQVGNSFDHPHEEHVLRAFLIVTKPNGKLQRLSTPITYRGEHSVPDSYLFGDTLIERRICEHFKIESVDQWKNVKDDKSYAYRALMQVSNLAHTLQEQKLFERHHCAHQGLLLGYLWAKAEAEIHIKPLAETALRIKEANKQGGKESGRLRLERAEQGWMKFAKMLAREIREEKPSATQDEVAEDLVLDWRPTWPKRPRFPSLRKLVGLMERSGELPRPSAPPKDI
jgi:hypothetical protein